MTIRFPICMLLVFGTITLGACARGHYEEKDPAWRAKTELVGMSKEKLLACAGEASEKPKHQGKEVWIYNVESESNNDYNYCQAKFAFKNGVVESLRYSVRYSDSRRFELCRPFVERCLTPR